MTFTSIKELLEQEEKEQKPLWKIILEDDIRERNTTENDSVSRMWRLWESMKLSSDSYDGNIHSASGLSCGNGSIIENYINKGNNICGSFIGEVMKEALSMAESNACMRRIVASPTAGSCGVLPAVLIPYSKKYNISDDVIIKSLYIASGLGAIIATRAGISGAEGGCQAEIGTASAMASATVVFLHGGNSQQSVHALALALKSLMGLVCDPVAGLVEVPCIKRNVIGAVNALTCADMALAGIKSAIPPDEVIDAMQEVGQSIPVTLRETGLGGLAVTPTGKEIAKKMKNIN